MALGNLGIALGSGVEEWNNQRRMARDDAAEGRAVEQFNWQRGEYEKKQAQEKALTEYNDKWKGINERLGKGDYTDANNYWGMYNADQGALKDGHKIKVDPTRKRYQVVNAEGGVANEGDLTHDSIVSMMQEAALRERGALLGADYGAFIEKDRAHGLEKRKIGQKDTELANTKQHYADTAIYQQGALKNQLIGFTKPEIDAAGGRGLQRIYNPTANKWEVKNWNYALHAPREGSAELAAASKEAEPLYEAMALYDAGKIRGNISSADHQIARSHITNKLHSIYQKRGLQMPTTTVREPNKLTPEMITQAESELSKNANWGKLAPAERAQKTRQYAEQMYFGAGGENPTSLSMDLGPRPGAPAPSAPAGQGMMLPLSPALRNAFSAKPAPVSDGNFIGMIPSR